MRISRHYTDEDWKGLTFVNEADWDKAVIIFEDRLQTRYLEHIRAILPRKTSSFAVLALDSILIETLEQFRRGTSKTPWGKGQEYFESFLTKTDFSERFDVGSAGLFYVTIRCGLLHQAETAGTSQIKRSGNIPVVTCNADGSGIHINTRSFHELLEKVIRKYAAELRTPGSTDARKAFRKKMDYICRME
jgi:hypothetical protein